MKQSEILERRRLQLEIKQLEKNLKAEKSQWWIRPVYLSILAPLAVGVITFLWNWNSGVYDAERRIAVAEAAIAELDLDSREQELQRQSELLELRQSIYADQRDAFNAINERICSAQSALDELERPWRLTDWTLGVLDIAEYEIQGLASRVGMIREILENSEFDDDELQRIVPIMSEFIETANDEGREFSQTLAMGRAELATQIEIFESVYQELSAYCFAGRN